MLLCFGTCHCYVDTKLPLFSLHSLYPWVNKYGIYILGHPEVITENFKNLHSYCGLIKCRLHPPRKMYHPILPYRHDGKLLFPLCRTCAETYQQTPCHHTREERCLTGTWVSLEVQKALEKGYQLEEVHEVWDYKTTQYDPATKKGGLFVDYINMFLKMKQEASGWPSEIKTEEQMNNYIDGYLIREGQYLSLKCHFEILIMIYD